MSHSLLSADINYHLLYVTLTANINYHLLYVTITAETTTLYFLSHSLLTLTILYTPQVTV